MNRRNVTFILVALVAIVADQASKLWVVANLAQDRDEMAVIPGFFSLVHRQNPGAAFGLFRDFEYRHLLFLVFTLIAAGLIIDLFRKLPTSDRFMSATLGLILSGAVGNAIDRVHKRTVTDFLKVYTDAPSLKGWLEGTFGTSEWPSFNVADAALVVGVLLYLFHQVFLEEKPEAAKDAKASEQSDTPPAAAG